MEWPTGTLIQPQPMSKWLTGTVFMTWTYITRSKTMSVSLNTLTSPPTWQESAPRPSSDLRSWPQTLTSITCMEHAGHLTLLARPTDSLFTRLNQKCSSNRVNPSHTRSPTPPRTTLHGHSNPCQRTWRNCHHAPSVTQSLPTSTTKPWEISSTSPTPYKLGTSVPRPSTIPNQRTVHSGSTKSSTRNSKANTELSSTPVMLMVLFPLMVPSNGSTCSIGKLKKNGDHTSLMTKLLDTLKCMMVLPSLLFMVLATWSHKTRDPKPTIWYQIGSPTRLFENEWKHHILTFSLNLRIH